MSFFDAPKYAPDMPLITGEFTDRIVNVLPALNSYIPVPSLVPVSEPVPDKVVSAYAIRVSGAIKIFVGTEKGLYSYQKTTNSWDNLTPEGVEYNATLLNPWSFAVFGDLLIAVNYWDKPQALSLSTPNAKFRDLGGNPPKAGFVSVWGDFLCLMRLQEHPRKIHWSALNNAEQWEVGKDSCDVQEFPDGDYVQGSSSATDPIILMKTCIYKGNFVPGSRLVFSFKKIHNDRGAKSHLSITDRGNSTFFLGESGFCHITSDGMLHAIGAGRVDRTIFAKFGNDILDNVRAVVDPVYNRVYWSIRPSAGTQSILVYDWQLDKWSTMECDYLLLFSAYSSGYNLDALDQVSTNVELIKISLDNKLWQDGAPILGAISRSNQLCYFTGDNMEATIVSPEYGRNDGLLGFFNKVFCEIDTCNALLSVGTRHVRDRDYPMAWSKEYYSSYHTGSFGIRRRSRYFRFKIRVPAGVTWSHFTGFNVDVQPAGDR